MTLAELRAEDRVVFRYVDNPNGSMDDIAGICSAGRNVVGSDASPRAGLPSAVGITTGRCDRSSSLRARRPALGLTSTRVMPACLEHRPVDAGLPPGRVADSLALRRSPARLHESSSSSVRSTFVLHAVELLVRSMRSWISSRGSTGRRMAADLRYAEPLLRWIRRALAPSLGLVGLECFQIAADGPSLGHGRLASAAL